MTTDTIGAAYFETEREYDEAAGALLSRIENAETGEAAIPTELEEDVRQFLGRASATGMLLDGANERRRCQSDIDFIAKLLERKTALSERHTLAPFDRQALEKVRQPAYPFDDWRTKDATPAPGARAIEALLTERAIRSGLRFEEGLIQDLSREVQSEPQGYPLLEFGLRELYENHRVGNKLYRPSPGQAFSCKRAFTERLKSFYAERGPTEREAVETVLVALTRRDWNLRRRGSGAVLDELKSARLVYQSETSSVGAADARPLRLVYQGVVGHWADLAEWVVAARRARQRNRRRLMVGLGGVTLIACVMLAAHLFISTRQDKADAMAITTFEVADQVTAQENLKGALAAADVWSTIMSRHAVFIALNRYLRDKPRTDPAARRGENTQAAAAQDVQTGGAGSSARPSGDVVAARLGVKGDDFQVTVGSGPPVKLKDLPPASAACTPGPGPGPSAVCDIKIGKKALAAVVKDDGKLIIKILSTSTGSVEGTIWDTGCESGSLGKVGISADGLVVSYTCDASPRFNVWSVSGDPVSGAAVERIRKFSRRSRDIFFAKRQNYFAVFAEPGVLAVASLYGKKNPRTFIFPTLGTVLTDVDFRRQSGRFAVLDLQDVLTIYEPTWMSYLRTHAPWFSPKRFDDLSVVFQMNVRGGNPKRQGPRGVEFTAGGRCVRVEQGDNSTDDLFVDNGRLMTAARSALGNRELVTCDDR
ncbi:MAG: hypothetical protein ACREF4_02735 [Gammaproteobacteria bacterium]